MCGRSSFWSSSRAYLHSGHTWSYHTSSFIPWNSVEHPLSFGWEARAIICPKWRHQQHKQHCGSASCNSLPSLRFPCWYHFDKMWLLDIWARPLNTHVSSGSHGGSTPHKADYVFGWMGNWCRWANISKEVRFSTFACHILSLLMGHSPTSVVINFRDMAPFSETDLWSQFFLGCFLPQTQSWSSHTQCQIYIYIRYNTTAHIWIYIYYNMYIYIYIHYIHFVSY